LNAAVDAGKLLARLGKHKAGKGCVYIKRPADVDLKVLANLVAHAAAQKGRQHARR
jgi:predicted GIY-YIG superfamily endonuclease